MGNGISITAATADEIGAIVALLEANDLPTAGVADHWRTFLVAREGETIVGCGGAEAYTNSALIRSIAVASDYRSRGVGRQIVRHLLDHLAARGLREFYLLTTTAESYFARRGFRVIDRDEVSPEVFASVEFQGACPASAVCMRLVML